MPDELLNKVIAAYGVNVSRRLPMQSGYRNKNYPFELSDGTMVNLIIYKREPGMEQTIKNAHRLGMHLDANQFPARTTYDPRILRVFDAPHEQFAGLYSYLPGETIPWNGYTMDHLKALGASMSSMHALLSDQPQKGLTATTSIYSALLKRMEAYFLSKAVREAVSIKLNLLIDPVLFPTFQRLMLAISHLPNQQPIHLDFVRGNILFTPDSNDISGVLDFEKAAYGSPIIDIARTLAFLLVDCTYKSESQIRKYFLYSGYTKRGEAHYLPIRIKIGKINIDVLEALIDFFLFYDFYKFLLHNPYESLRENQHFTRTKDLLITRKIIVTT